MLINDILEKIIDNPEWIELRLRYFYKKDYTIKEEKKDRCWYFEDKDAKLKIEYGSINSVKGETHTATLVCETFGYDYDIRNVFEKHIKCKDNKSIRTINYLHKLYVGFTRPTDMLCVAITGDTYNKYTNEIKKLDVEIINVGDDENET